MSKRNGYVSAINSRRKLTGVASCEAQGYMKSLALTGRYRSGQTGQTVNLLSLSLRWFESSPAHICQLPCVLLVAASSSLATTTVTPAATVSATTAVTSTTAAAATTRRTLLARTRLIYSHRPAIHSVAVE